MNKELIPISKFLSFVLRHKPEEIGLILDEQGWVDVSTLLEAVHRSGRRLSLELLQAVVFSNDKQRFAFSPDGQRIRANQGHSVSINLALEPQVPPETLYHGTATRFLDSILQSGLLKMQRNHVHLSATPEIAQAVGIRHGKPIVLEIEARSMHDAGYPFYLSENGVWLTEHVSKDFIKVASGP